MRLVYVNVKIAHKIIVVFADWGERKIDATRPILSYNILTLSRPGSTPAVLAFFSSDAAWLLA